MSERAIQQRLFVWLKKGRPLKLVVPNLSMKATLSRNLRRYANWEADLLYVNKRMESIEMEIKITRADFKADLLKVEKHEAYANRLEGTANQFYYVCPPHLLKASEMPKYAGLIYADAEAVRVIKKAPRLHAFPFSRNALEKGFSSMMWRFWSMRIDLTKHL